METSKKLQTDSSELTLKLHLMLFKTRKSLRKHSTGISRKSNKEVRNLKQFETDHVVNKYKKKTRGYEENYSYCLICSEKYDPTQRRLDHVI